MSSNSKRKGEVDMSFKVGEVVWVPCAIQLGPFPDERLVTVETREGPISGFVKQVNLQTVEADPEHGQIKGTVMGTDDESIIVKLFCFVSIILSNNNVQAIGILNEI